VAVAHSLLLGTYDADPTSTFDVSCSGGTSGRHLTLAVICPGDRVVTGVTDSAGNTWTVHETVANATTVAISVASCYASSSPATVSVTLSADATWAVAWVDEWTGGDTTGWTDVDISATGSDNAPASGSTGTSSSAAGLVIGMFGQSGSRTLTQGSGFTKLRQGVTSAFARTGMLEYKVVSGAAAYSADCTSNGSAAWAAICVVLQAAASAHSVTLTAATETDAAVALTVLKPIYVTVTAAAETDAAVALTVTGGAHLVTVTPATETDAAQTLAVVKTILKTLTPAAETDTAVAVTFTQAGVIEVTLTPATETDTAVALTFTGPRVWASVHPDAPSISVEVSWGTDPAGTPSWQSVTARLREYHARLYRQTELDEFQTGTFTLVLGNADRELEPLYAGSSLYPNVIPRKRIRVQAKWGGTVYDRVTGFVRGIDVRWPGQADAVVTLDCADYGMILNRAQVTLDGYPEETVTARIGRVLDEIGVPAGDRDLDTSEVLCAEVPVPAEGEQSQTVGALAHCRQAAMSDGGYLFVSRDGKVTFHNAQHRRDLASSGTLGDAGAGEIPYRPSLVAGLDDSRLWNRAAVLAADGTREETTDSTSQTAYWPARRDDFQSLCAYPGEAAALASLFVWRYRDPRLRLPKLEVLLAEQGNMTSANVATLLAADVGVRFTVKRRPPGGGAAIDQGAHLEGLQEDVVPGGWRLMMDLSPADTTTTWWELGTHSLADTAYVAY